MTRNIEEKELKDFDIDRIGLLYHGSYTHLFRRILKEGIRAGYFSLIGAHYLGGAITRVKNNNVAYLDNLDWKTKDPLISRPYFFVVDLPDDFGSDISDEIFDKICEEFPRIVSKKQVMNPIKYKISNGGVCGVRIHKLLEDNEPTDIDFPYEITDIDVPSSWFKAIVVPSADYVACTHLTRSKARDLNNFRKEIRERFCEPPSGLEYALLYDFKKEEIHGGVRVERHIKVDSEGMKDFLIKEMEEVFEERKDHIPIFRSDGVCLYNPHQ